MNFFKEKGTRWLPSDKNLVIKEGFAISINYLSTGEEFNRELLKADDVLFSCDEVLCKTDCYFISRASEKTFEVPESQYTRLLFLCSIREEKLATTRVAMLLKHLISEYSESPNHQDVGWIPAPLGLTHGQIAGLVSSTRVTITKAIAELVEQNIVKKEGRQIFFNRENL